MFDIHTKEDLIVHTCYDSTKDTTEVTIQNASVVCDVQVGGRWETEGADIRDATSGMQSLLNKLAVLAHSIISLASKTGNGLVGRCPATHLSPS